MRVLLAEDDVRLGKLIKHLLEQHAMQVEWVTRGDTAIDYGLHSTYDMIILDWMMPGYTGIEVCARLRKQNFQGAILLLTARDAITDRILGLDTGADDYLVKPFEFSELLARMRALSRRCGKKLQEEVVRLNDLALNRTTRGILRGEEEIRLTAREFQLLDLLIQNQGRVVPRELILDRIWGLEAEVSSNTLDAYIRLLRKKISTAGNEVTIQNIRGIGYKLEVCHVHQDS